MLRPLEGRVRVWVHVGCPSPPSARRVSPSSRSMPPPGPSPSAPPKASSGWGRAVQEHPKCCLRIGGWGAERGTCSGEGTGPHVAEGSRPSARTPATRPGRRCARFSGSEGSPEQRGRPRSPCLRYTRRRAAALARTDRLRGSRAASKGSPRAEQPPGPPGVHPRVLQGLRWEMLTFRAKPASCPSQQSPAKETPVTAQQAPGERQSSPLGICPALSGRKHRYLKSPWRPVARQESLCKSLPRRGLSANRGICGGCPSPEGVGGEADLGKWNETLRFSPYLAVSLPLGF